MIGTFCKCGQLLAKRRKCPCCGCGPADAAPPEHHNAAWNRMSKRIRRKHPVCQRCQAQGKVSATEEVHHIVPVHADPSRLLDETNVIAVCHDCHEKLEGRKLPYPTSKGRAKRVRG